MFGSFCFGEHTPLTDYETKNLKDDMCVRGASGPVPATRPKSTLWAPWPDKTKLGLWVLRGCRLHKNRAQRLYVTLWYIHGPQSNDMVTPLRPTHLPHSYMIHGALERAYSGYLGFLLKPGSVSTTEGPTRPKMGYVCCRCWDLRIVITKFWI